MIITCCPSLAKYKYKDQNKYKKETKTKKNLYDNLFKFSMLIYMNNCGRCSLMHALLVGTFVPILKLMKVYKNKWKYASWVTA